MEKPLESSPSLESEKAIPLQGTAPTTKAFWDSFSVFMSPFEKFCVRRWYIFWIVYFALWLVSAFVTDIAFGTQYEHDMWTFFRGENFRFSELYYVFFTRWLYNVFISGMFLSLGLANYWQQSIPAFFRMFEQRCHLADPQQSMEKAYLVQLEAYKHALLHGRRGTLTRPVIIGIVTFCSFIALAVQFISGDIPGIAQFGYTHNIILILMQGIQHFEIDFFYPLLLMFLATNIIWILATTGIYVRRIVKRFPLHIQLAHPDNCGGFKFLGDFALRMALIVLAAATVFALFSIWRGYSIWSIGTSILLLFLIAISYGTFFAPISAVHQVMLKERHDYEDALASRAAKIIEVINEALRKGDLSQLKTAKEELEVVKALFPDTIGFVSWPFNWRILITFLGSQVVPIISFIAGVSPFASDLFAKIFSFLSGH